MYFVIDSFSIFARLAAGGGINRDDLPQAFPIIDNDLNVLGSHFNYDQLAASISLDSPVRIPPVSKDATLDISGDLTPISTCSDWEFNTNDATKGSTNTNCDLVSNIFVCISSLLIIHH